MKITRISDHCFKHETALSVFYTKDGNTLHKEDGPAFIWRHDGTELYMLDGVTLWNMTQENFTPEFVTMWLIAHSV